MNDAGGAATDAPDLSVVTAMQDMFLNVTLSAANYDALLMGWEEQALQAGVNFHGGNSTYCLGEAARTNMIDNKHYTKCHSNWHQGNKAS